MMRFTAHRSLPARCFVRAIAVALTGLFLAARATADDKTGSERTKVIERYDKIRAELPDVLAVDVQNQLDDLRLANARLYSVLQPGTDNLFGATLSPADKALRAQLDLGDFGLVISNIADGGPAAQVGLRDNDILVELNGASLNTPGTVAEVLKMVGEKPAKLRVIREGKPVELTLKPVYRVTFGPVGPEQKPYMIGVQIDTPDDTLRAHVKDLPAGQGLVASAVVPDSPAQKAGLKPFDILLECGGKPLSEPSDLVAQVQGSQGKPLTLKVLRGGKTRTFDVTPEPRKDAPAAARALAEELSLVYINQPPGRPNYDPAWFTARVGRNPVRHYVTVTPDGQTTAIPASGTLEQRLDTIATELANLRKALDELKKDLGGDAKPGK